MTLFAASLLFACKNESKDAAKTDSTTATATAKTDDWVPVDSATAMKTMMEVSTPGPEHAMLAKSNGDWKAETTMWISPDAPPTVSTGMVNNKMIMGGRYQQMSFKGNMMGAPFEGTGTTGYDKGSKKWVNTWYDNMSTGIMTMEGTWDDASKTVTYTGKMLCPANGKWVDMKEIFKIVDDNNQVMEMYGPDMKTGKLYKSMEIKLARK